MRVLGKTSLEPLPSLPVPVSVNGQRAHNAGVVFLARSLEGRYGVDGPPSILDERHGEPVSERVAWADVLPLIPGVLRAVDSAVILLI